MTFTFKLERLDGSPAEPATIKSTVRAVHAGLLTIHRDLSTRVQG
jgi:hypothetical protein